MTDLVTVAVDQGVATISLNRPEKRNALNLEMWTALGSLCRRLADDPDAGVLVLRGAGAHFCAGADIAELGKQDEAFGAANLEAEEALAAFPRPTVAFIRGSCVGGGVQIAASCDLRIADTTALLGITPARLGILYPARALERAVGLVGPSAAKHLLYSAELIDATRALRIGLLDEVHPPELAEQRLEQLTRLMASQRSTLTQQASKAMIDEVVGLGAVSATLSALWAREADAASDPAEGVAAFLERRAPRFTWDHRTH